MHSRALFASLCQIDIRRCSKKQRGTYFSANYWWHQITVIMMRNFKKGSLFDTFCKFNLASVCVLHIKVGSKSYRLCHNHHPVTESSYCLLVTVRKCLHYAALNERSKIVWIWVCLWHCMGIRHNETVIILRWPSRTHPKVFVYVLKKVLIGEKWS